MGPLLYMRSVVDRNVVTWCIPVRCLWNCISCHPVGIYSVFPITLELFCGWHMSVCVSHYAGRFIMFSMITNIYNKKTKGPTLMELFTATGKLKKFFWQLEMFDVCTTGDTAHIDTIFKYLPHTRQTWVLSACTNTQFQ